MAKLSETAKSRIWLYGLVIGGIALCSLLVNGWNLHTARLYGVLPSPTAAVAEAENADQPLDLTALAQNGQDRALLDGKELTNALRAGRTVVVRVTPPEEPPAYLRVTGATEEAFLMRDGSGAPVTDPVRFYRFYLVNTP